MVDTIANARMSSANYDIRLPPLLLRIGDHECRFSILTFPYLIFVVFDETERRNSTNRKFLIGISII